jgi:hypothetical protein
VIAIGYFSAWVYRCHSRGDSLSLRRVLYGAALFLASLALAWVWQATSKAKDWSWWMAFMGFSLSLGIVSVAVIAFFRATA